MEDDPVHLIDIAVNLTDEMFRGMYRGKQKHEDDFEQVLERAKEFNVKTIIGTGTCLDTSTETIQIANDHENFIYSTVGCHPTNCKLIEDYEEGGDRYIEKLTNLINENPNVVVAVGECGLDYYREEFCPRDIQKKWFLKQIDIAEQTGLPMFLHNRETEGEFLEIMRENRHRIVNGVVHSFDGSVEEMKALVDLDLFIGINGCSLKQQHNADVVKEIPIENLLIETDAPWCDIRPSHSCSSLIKTQFEKKKVNKFELGKCVKGRNEPCNLVQVLEVVSGLLNVDLDTLTTQIFKNTRRLFKLIK